MSWLDCGRCGAQRPLADDLDVELDVLACPVCGCEDLDLLGVEQ